jgi:hypothetical protein
MSGGAITSGRDAIVGMDAAGWFSSARVLVARIPVARATSESFRKRRRVFIRSLTLSLKCFNFYHQRG